MAGKIIDEDVLKLTVQNLTQLIADNVYEEIPYQDSEIDDMFDATTQEIDYYSSLISDSLVSENRIFSSRHVTDLLQQLQLDANSYADGLLANISSIELKYVTSLPTTGNSNTIYILKSTDTNPDTLNLYNDGAWISIGQFTISLDNYYDKTQVDGLLDTKANDNEVLKLDNILTTTGTETNDNVYSAKLTKTELDKKANDSEVVKKTDISTTIDKTSTDNTVPSAKAVFTPIDKIQNDLSTLTTVTDLDNFKGKYFMIGRGTAYNNGCANVPNGITGAFVVEYFPYNSGESYGVQRLTLVQAVNGKYSTFERSLDNGNWMGWQRLCSTSVADSSGTATITPAGTTGTVRYKVINGICYVEVSNLAQGITGLSVCSITGLPKTDVYVDKLLDLDGVCVGSIYCNAGQSTFVSHKSASSGGYSSFSYPVAES